MDDNLAQLSILLPALLAGFLVLSTHIPMGREVLRRGIIFLDLAIAQVAAFGLILAGTLGVDTHDGHASHFLSQCIAMGAAIAGASMLYTFRHAAPKIQEALIGILFMLAATGSILLLAKDPQGGERLKDILVGQILWVEYSDLWLTTILYSAVLVIWFTLRDRLGDYIFYPLFAVTITLSTQLIGVYLVFASLIIPALSTLHRKRPLLAAYLIGGLGYITGLLLSAYFDLPTGAMITWSLAVVGCLFYMMSSRLNR